MLWPCQAYLQDGCSPKSHGATELSATRIGVLVGIASVLVVVGVMTSNLFNQLGAETDLSRYASQVEDDITRVAGSIPANSQFSFNPLQGACFVVQSEEAAIAGLCDRFRRSRPAGKCRPIIVLGDLSKSKWAPSVEHLNAAVVSEMAGNRAAIVDGLSAAWPQALVSSAMCDGFSAFQVSFGRPGD